MSTAEMREYLNHRIDQLSPNLLRVVVEFVDFLLQRRANLSAKGEQEGLSSQDLTSGFWEQELTAIANSVAVPKTLTAKERQAELNRLFGAWADQEDLQRAFTEIEQERHRYRGRSLDSLD